MMSYSASGGAFGSAQSVVNTTDYIGSADWAMDAHGNVVVVWGDGYQDAIFARRFNAAGGQWGTVRSLAHPVGGTSVRVAMTSGGDAFAVWAATQSSSGAGQFIDASRYFAATDNWSGAPATLRVAKTPTALNIALDSNSNAFVQWTQANPQNIRSVYQDCFNAETGGWGGASVANPTRYGEGLFPVGAMDAAGNAFLVWSQAFATTGVGTPSIMLGVAARRYRRAAASWGAWQRIDSFSQGASYLAQVAPANNTGDAIVVWYYTAGSLTEGIVRFRQYSAASDAWTLQSRLDTSTPSGPDPFHLRGTVIPSPSVAMGPDGAAVVVWMQAEGIYGDVRSHSGTWSTPQEIEELAASPTVGAHPTVTVDDQENATMAWIEPGSGGASVMVARYRPPLIP
jgi:hypothetical protein